MAGQQACTAVAAIRGMVVTLAETADAFLASPRVDTPQPAAPTPAARRRAESSADRKRAKNAKAGGNARLGLRVAGPWPFRSPE